MTLILIQIFITDEIWECSKKIIALFSKVFNYLKNDLIVTQFLYYFYHE